MIREIRKNEVDEFVKANMEARRTIERARKHDKLEIMKDYVLETFKEGKVFGYFVDGKIIGGIGIIVRKIRGFGEIRHLFVHQDFRRNGIARILSVFVEDYAKKIKLNRLKLVVLKENKPAIKFYKDNKYKVFGYKMEKWL